MHKAAGVKALRSAASTASAAASTPPYVAEDIYVLSGPLDDAVSDQRVAAAQSEPMRGGGTQRDSGHLAVEVADRHQIAAAAAACRSGCASSQACRTPLGR